MVYLSASAGLLLLFLGAQLLIRGASHLGVTAGISPIVVGLTIVAFGTSTPELLVSVMGAWSGQVELALGNVIGSNIFNVLFILGVSAALVPLVVNQRLLHWDAPFLLGLTLLTYLLALDGLLSLVEGVLLVSILILYTAWAIRQSGLEDPGIRKEYAQTYGPEETTLPEVLPTPLVFLLITLLGLSLLIVGSRLFTRSATTLARGWGVPEMVIGLTVVAAGTSLPEVATSLVAALNGKTDIAVGNVVGSNLFNLTGVLGLSVLTTGEGIPVPPAVLEFDLLVLIVVSILCLPIFFTGHRISRPEGMLFVLVYGLYTLAMVGFCCHPFIVRSLPYALWIFLVPLTALTVMGGLYRHLLSQRGGV